MYYESRLDCSPFIKSYNIDKGIAYIKYMNYIIHGITIQVKSL